VGGGTDEIGKAIADGMKAIFPVRLSPNRDDVAFLFKPMRFSFTKHGVAALERAG
jgi:hypothetical protein